MGAWEACAVSEVWAAATPMTRRGSAASRTVLAGLPRCWLFVQARGIYRARIGVSRSGATPGGRHLPRAPVVDRHRAQRPRRRRRARRGAARGHGQAQVIVADTGAVIALIDADDDHHEAMQAIYDRGNEPWILPWAILPEVDYLLGAHVSTRAQAAFIKDLAAGLFAIEWGPVRRHRPRLRAEAALQVTPPRAGRCGGDGGGRAQESPRHRHRRHASLRRGRDQGQSRPAPARRLTRPIQT